MPRKSYHVAKILLVLTLALMLFGCYLPCSDNSGCLFDTYCAKQPGDCNGTGECAVKPEACPEVWAPVCGCDGETYSSACHAASAGENVDHKGECRDTSCDDGTDPLCEMIPPVCKDYEILAVQNSCWVCVNPSTCLPWGVPECKENEDCDPGDVCDDCGSSSCPACDDCVPACVEK